MGAVLLACLLVWLPMSGLAEGDSCDPSCADARKALVSGDWYVLIHYEETGPEAESGPQWDDQIWSIEASGRNLRWTIFPHVELKNAQGRYRETSDGLMARTSGAWSPDPKQWQEIRAGLKKDSYSTRAKTLRVAQSGEWRSSGRLRSGSASMVGYHELWEIRFEEEGPVFSRVDSMGSGRTDVLAGETRYTTTVANPEEGEIEGLYQHGDTVQGRFKMVRMKGGSSSGSGS